MEDKSMTNQESLDLITRMIRNSQEKFERGAGVPFLVWGYTTLAISLAVWYALKTTANYQWHWLWFAIPVIGTVLMLFTTRKKQKLITTFIDRAIWQVWLTLGICAILTASYAAFSDKYVPTLLIISMLMFAGEAITGAIIKMGYIKVMGLIGIFLSFGLPFLQGIDQILGFGGLFLIAMVIPGHIMNMQANKLSKDEK